MGKEKVLLRRESEKEEEKYQKEREFVCVCTCVCMNVIRNCYVFPPLSVLFYRVPLFTVFC